MYVNKYVKLGYKSTKKTNKIFHLGNFDEDSFGSELLTNVVKFLIKPDLSLVGFHTLINFWELQKTNSAYQ